VTPELDPARELLDFCSTKIISFVDDYGVAPTAIALVLFGRDGEKSFTDAYSWDSTETRTRLETCGTASAILLKRAIDQ
jgi:hypothetical protein